MIIGMIDIAPADRHSFNVIVNKSSLAIAIVKIAVTNTLIQDPTIEFKNFILLEFFSSLVIISNRE